MKRIISVVIAVIMLCSFAVTGVAATYKIGDVDKNGSVTPADARQILRYAAMLDVYTDEEKLLADISGDGELTPSDARQTLRIAAGLDSSDVEVVLSGDDLGDCIGMSLSEFIEKYGAMETVGTSDGTKTYKNNSITVVSDPGMISGDKISSITVTGSDYTVKGIKTGMSKDEVKSLLSTAKWILKSENDVLCVYAKDGLLIKFVCEENLVKKVIICLAYSLVNDDDDMNDEPDGWDDNADYLNLAELPEVAQHFLSGQFGLNGSIFSNGAQTDVAMYTDSVNINMSAVIDMGEDGVVDMTILMLDEGDTDSKVYFLNNDNEKYIELSDSTLAVINNLTGGSLDLKKSDFNIDFNLNDPATLKITMEEKSEDGKNYIVYKAKGANNITNLYFENDNIEKIVITDFYGNVITVIEVDEIMYPLPDNCFSYRGYKKVGLTALFDFSIF